MGATVIEGGVNFSLFSRTTTGVELLQGHSQRCPIRKVLDDRTIAEYAETIWGATPCPIGE